MEKNTMGTAYIYGADNGSEYRSVEKDRKDGKSDGVEFETHYDPRIQVTGFGPDMGLVQVGVVPPSDHPAENGEALWLNDDGQFIQLDRKGMARLIKELQEVALAAWGRDPW